MYKQKAVVQNLRNGFEIIGLYGVVTRSEVFRPDQV